MAASRHGATMTTVYLEFNQSSTMRERGAGANLPIPDSVSLKDDFAIRYRQLQRNKHFGLEHASTRFQVYSLQDDMERSPDELLATGEYPSQNIDDRIRVDLCVIDWFQRQMITVDVEPLPASTN